MALSHDKLVVYVVRVIILDENVAGESCGLRWVSNFMALLMPRILFQDFAQEGFGSLSCWDK